MTAEFSYNRAFYRNIGWTTDWEQALLKNKKIAIAGMGGVGSNYLLTLLRLGIANYHIADLDIFEVGNFNRQAGATMSSNNKPKVDTMLKMAKDINPEANIKTFPKGVQDENIDKFLEGVDLCVDGFDLFAMDIREKTFARCHELGIPVITCGPTGTGGSYMVFMPGGMTFQEYFRTKGLSTNKKTLNFLTGLAPAGLHRGYLVDYSRINLDEQNVCSLPMGCQISAGIVATEAMKILLGRGKIKAAPYYSQFDSYTGKYVSRKLHCGNDNWLQKIKLALTYKLSEKLTEQARPRDEIYGREQDSDIKNILDHARWAPSPVNSQPWKFKITGTSSATVYVKRTTNNLYSFTGTTLLTAGHLLESIRLAATDFSRDFQWKYKGLIKGEHIIDVKLKKDKSISRDGLLDFLPVRTTNRWNYHKTPLTTNQRKQLEKSLGKNLKIKWLDECDEQYSMAKINMISTKIRSITPECHAVHQKAFDFNNLFSEKALPSKSLGLSILSLPFLKWAMKSWENAQLLHKLPFATLFAQLELDFFPSINCAAHFVITPKLIKKPITNIQKIEDGMAIQRFWLTATSLGIAMQPNQAPLAFAKYAVEGKRFTEKETTLNKAKKLAKKLENLTHKSPVNIILMGRIGKPRHHSTFSRSLRKPLKSLMKK